MEAIFMTGVLLLCVMLVTVAVSGLTNRSGHRMRQETDIITVIPLRRCDAVCMTQLKRLLAELRWTDEALTGRILLLNLDADPQLLAYCATLCEQHAYITLCERAELETQLLRQMEHI